MDIFLSPDTSGSNLGHCPIGIPMHDYHFSIRNLVSQNEELGFIEMTNDEEALAFARAVIRDVMKEPGGQYSGSVLDIVVGNRSVGSLLFNFEIQGRQKTHLFADFRV